MLLVISAEGIDIEEAGKPDPANGSTITAVPGKVIRQVPIRQIAFVKEDTKNKKVVGFIASDPKTGSLMCHVFQTVSGVSCVIVAIVIIVIIIVIVIIVIVIVIIAIHN